MTASLCQCPQVELPAPDRHGRVCILRRMLQVGGVAKRACLPAREAGTGAPGPCCVLRGPKARLAHSAGSRTQNIHVPKQDARIGADAALDVGILRSELEGFTSHDLQILTARAEAAAAARVIRAGELGSASTNGREDGGVESSGRHGDADNRQVCYRLKSSATLCLSDPLSSPTATLSQPLCSQSEPLGTLSLNLNPSAATLDPSATCYITLLGNRSWPSPTAI